LYLESAKYRDYSLPERRYLQAYVKYLKINQLLKEYKGQLHNSERARDLAKDCLNDMVIALELKYGRKGKWEECRWIGNAQWEPWMHDLAKIRNHAIHKVTAFAIKKSEFGPNKGSGVYFVVNKLQTTNEQVLPYLEKTLQKIKEKLESRKERM
jgi:hypothetical protein